MIKKGTIFLLFVVFLLGLGMIHFSYDPDFSFLHLGIHIPAILAVISIFFAILLPLNKNRLTDIKGTQLKSLHHFFSYLGWISVLVHMLFLFIKIKKWTLFIPSFSNIGVILGKSGPIAVILLILGSIGLFFLKRWKTFQTIHAINILAFFWITVHGIFKDKALPNNMPYFLLLLIMDLYILFLLITNAVKSDKQKKPV